MPLHASPLPPRRHRPRSSDSPPPRWVVARSQDRAEFTLSIWCCAAATACLPQQALPVCLSQLRDDATSFLPSAAESNARCVDTPFQTHTHPTQATASLRAYGVEERMPPEESSVTVAWCATWRGSDARMRPVRACVCRVTCMATHGLNPNKQWRRTHHRSLRRSAGTG